MRPVQAAGKELWFWRRGVTNVLARHLPRQHRNLCYGCPASKRNRQASEPPSGLRQSFHPPGRAGSGADPSGHSHRISKPTPSPQRPSRRGNAGAAPVARSCFFAQQQHQCTAKSNSVFLAISPSGEKARERGLAAHRNTSRIEPLKVDPASTLPSLNPLQPQPCRACAAFAR